MLTLTNISILINLPKSVFYELIIAALKHQKKLSDVKSRKL